MALATLIAAYSIAGGIVLFLYGQFLFPSKDLEVPVYGGVSMGIGACSVLLLLAFANRSRRESTSSSLFRLVSFSPFLCLPTPRPTPSRERC